MKSFQKALRRYQDWPKRTDVKSKYKDGYENEAAPGIDVRLTCGLCQNICWGNPKDTAKNYKLLTNSGCVIQNPDGSIVILPPEEAEEYFKTLPKKHQKLYAIE